MRLVLPLILILAACGAPGESPSPSDAGGKIEGTWRLTDGRSADGEVPIVDDYPITLTIDGSSISGTAACNGYGGRLAFDGGRLTIEDLTMTAMGCEPPVAASEAAYSSALSAVTALGRDGESLVLRGPDVELRFAAVPPVPTAELVGTSWVLETLFVGDVASSVLGGPATLSLVADGTFSGSTGCRTFDGEWVEAAGQIVATTMQTTDEACDQELVMQDSHVLGVVGDGFVPTIEEDLLTLTDPGGVGLVYRLRR